ncbi:MAG: NAD(P)/FAD-dependent oxidoreductase [Candidatus Babeliaceae bacterium]|nr:NAD(P)/FAD-dependent oxidoreductase [Candidatus Babeliaceae bacterium]
MNGDAHLHKKGLFMKKSIAIIGGGVSGLCTGSFAAAAGFQPIIYEMNKVPGGLCTGWQKGDYTVDFCISWLTGAADTNDGCDLYHDWKFLGVIDQLTYVFPQEITRIINTDGRQLAISTDLDTFEQNMLSIAPEDECAIKDLIAAIRKFAKNNLGLHSPTSFGERIENWWRLLTMASPLYRYGNLSMQELGLQFKNQFLREAFTHSWDPRLSAMSILAIIAWAHCGICGYPIGGSQAFARALESRFKELGGIIRYEAPIEKILVEENQAVGVKLADGEECHADYVISAADGYSTLFELLGGEYVTQKIASYYRDLPIFGPLLFLAFGVDKSFADFPHQLSNTIFKIPKITIADREHEWLQVKIHNTDPTLAPDGKTVLSVFLDSNFDFWQKLSENRDQYEEMKKRVADIVANLLNEQFPGIISTLEMKEVITPVSVHRWTKNWHGSYEGWLSTPQTIFMHMERTLPGLKNFYMVGHWVQPGGGLPSCVITAKEVMNMLCEHAGR